MEKQSKEESIALFELEETYDMIPKMSKLFSTVKPLIMDYTITYNEFRDELAATLVTASDAKDDTVEDREVIVNKVIDNLIEKYKKIKFDAQVVELVEDNSEDTNKENTNKDE